MIIGSKSFDFDKNTYIMGIINVTPDSFYDGGKLNTADSTLKAALRMEEEGADIIDIGGESTRPGYAEISAAEEMERVIPVIEKIRKETDIPVSIDTYKAVVAEEALLAGADIVNDIWGLKGDLNMADVISRNDAQCCIMHNRKSNIYGNFLDDVLSDLKESVNLAKNAGIKKDKIIIDPGIGFAKNYEQNLLIIKNLDILKELDMPVLFAASRKSVIGLALDLPVTDRLEGTLALTAYAALKGAGIVRVHDVAENVRVIKMIKAVMGA